MSTPTFHVPFQRKHLPVVPVVAGQRHVPEPFHAESAGDQGRFDAECHSVGDSCLVWTPVLVRENVSSRNRDV